jgi:hypothetical protein
MERMPLRWSMSPPPTTPHLRWSILAADPGVVIAGITGIAGGAREATLVVVAGTAEIQPDLGAGRNYCTTISAIGDIRHEACKGPTL